MNTEVCVEVDVQSVPSFTIWQNVHYIDIDLCTLTLFSYVFLQLVHIQTQICCTPQSQVISSAKNQVHSYSHLVFIHGRGAGSLKP